MRTLRITLGCVLAGTLLSAAPTRSATAPFAFECNKEAGFVSDTNEHKRVGYITALDGFGLPSHLQADITVSPPFQGSPAYRGIQITQSAQHHTARVVGVIEKFEWEGSVGSPIAVDFYVSHENAIQLKALQEKTLKTASVQALGWWIADYDQETKHWYEQSHPQSSPTVTGIIGGGDHPELHVDLTPVPAKDGVDVNVYKVSIKVAPAANHAYSLLFANSSTKHVTKSWGLVVPPKGH